ncbi:hypothetical protein ACI3PL_26365, partial [Lacticaseibacillus paracasei]
GAKVPGANPKNIDPNKIDAYKAARNKLSNNEKTGILDQSPEYQQAMKVSQGRIIQRQYEEVIGRKATKGGRKVGGSDTQAGIPEL